MRWHGARWYGNSWDTNNNFNSSSPREMWERNGWIVLVWTDDFRIIDGGTQGYYLWFQWFA
jgi:hypothetical protein